MCRRINHAMFSQTDRNFKLTNSLDPGFFHKTAHCINTNKKASTGERKRDHDNTLYCRGGLIRSTAFSISIKNFLTGFPEKDSDFKLDAVVLS